MRLNHHLLVFAGAALLLPLLFFSAVDAQDTPDAEPAELPQLIALRYHADWCGACTKLAPTFDALKDRFKEQSILFVTLDFTRPSDVKQSEYLAGSLGLGEIWRDNAMTTGRVLVIDRESGKLVGTYTTNQSPQEMTEALENLIRE